MHVTYQVYTFINIINLSIQIYPYKTELDLPRVRLNSRLNNCLARLIQFISIPFRPLRLFFLFFDHLNGQPFNFRLPLNKIIYHRLPFSGRLIGRLDEHFVAGVH